MTDTNGAKLAFLRACDEEDEAQDRKAEAMVKAFPVGSEVSWRHGDHWRSGDIIAYGTARVKVRSHSTGNEYWIDQFYLEWAAREECHA